MVGRTGAGGTLNHRATSRPCINYGHKLGNPHPTLSLGVKGEGVKNSYRIHLLARIRSHILKRRYVIYFKVYFTPSPFIPRER